MEEGGLGGLLGGDITPFCVAALEGLEGGPASSMLA
jgi:hypothetical protein